MSPLRAQATVVEPEACALIAAVCNHDIIDQADNAFKLESGPVLSTFSVRVRVPADFARAHYFICVPPLSSSSTPPFFLKTVLTDRD